MCCDHDIVCDHNYDRNSFTRQTLRLLTERTLWEYCGFLQKYSRYFLARVRGGGCVDPIDHI